MNNVVLTASQFTNVFWLESQRLSEKEQSRYHLYGIYHYSSQLNLLKLKQALQSTVNANYNLRSNYLYEDGELKQIIHYHIDIQIHEFEAQTEEESKKYLLEQINKPFNIESDPLYRFAIVTNKFNHTFSLLLNFHHIILDGSQYDVVINQIQSFYANQTATNYHDNEEINQLKKYLDWEKQNLDQVDSQYLVNKLNNYQLNTALPCDNQQTQTSLTFMLDNKLYQKLKNYSLNKKYSLFNIIKTIMAVVLSKYARQNEIVLTYPLSMRKKEFKDVKGCLVNTVYDSYKINEQTLDTMLQNVYQDIEQSIQNRTYLLSPITLREKVDISEVNCTVSSASTQLKGPELDSMIGSEAMTYPLCGSDLALFYSDNKGLLLQLRMLEGILNDDIIQGFSTHFSSCLENLLDNSETLALSKVSLLSTAQREHILYRLNQTHKTFATHGTLHQLFEYQVERNPHRIAVVYEDQALTYEQLNQKANQLANYIREQYAISVNNEVKPDTFIPLLIDRGLDMIIGILAILKAGAAYVPIDPKAPQERIQHILSDTKPAIILSSQGFEETLNSLTSAVIINLEKHSYGDKPSTNLIPINQDTDLAYVIYTSGTTGNPKGVMVEHRSVVNTLSGLKDIYSITSNNNKFSSVAPIVFDASVPEIFAPLVNGCELHVISDNVRYSPELFSHYINEHALNYINIPPALLPVFPRVDYPSIRALLLGGEPCEPKAALYWSNKYNLYNVYGPTETSIVATCAKMTGAKTTVIGKPLANQSAYILDNNLEPVPYGIVGELYIGGAGVTRGYLNQPQLTQERFLENPFANQEDITNGLTRMYKTGDLVRMDSKGNIEYVGRNDNQIKIRGFRIEIAEIENALSNIAEIDKACVLAKEVNGTKEIVCYYVARRDDLTPEKMRAQLKNSLLEYMIPTYWQKMHALPLTVNGKIDYRKLSALNVKKSLSSSTPQNITQIQTDILSIWQDLLSRDNIGLDDNFFDVGGHSLKIIQVKLKLEELLPEVEVTTLDLFTYTTIRTLSEYILKNKKSIPQKYYSTDSTDPNEEIAIIGMSGAFSGSSTIQEYWENINNGKECIEFLNADQYKEMGLDPRLYTKENFIPAGGRVNGVEEFDPAFWGLSPNDSVLLDPLIRKFLEHSWFVIQQAGYIKNRKEITIGVFCGAGSSAYMSSHLLNNPDAPNVNAWELGSMHANTSLATRISYMLGLTGPAITVNTACSTSLVSIIEACEKLVAKKCDMALAGGVSLLIPEQHGYLYQEGMIYSKDGHCRPFDEKASGTINGSGIGVILLKRLKDAIKDGDNIIALIKGYSTNNDGQRKVGFTAPSTIGQAECILAAQHHAGITSDTISYVECHGTGTKLGDPIEIAALSDAFNNNVSENKNIDCILGSVKAVIGHADSAAGVAGVIKVCKMIENKTIPPQINFKSLNTEIKMDDKQFKIVTKASQWAKKDYPRRAAVSSFGIGGTNAHIILEEYEAKVSNDYGTVSEKSNPVYILPFSAKSTNSLKNYQHVFQAFIADNSETLLSDIAYTLQEKHEHFSCRNYVVGQNHNDIVENLKKLTRSPSVTPDYNVTNNLIFMFSGQGSQYRGMGANLYKKEPIFKNIVDHCFDLIKFTSPLTIDDLFNETNIDINQTQWSQPLLFIISYATAKLLESWNINPVAYIGHSIGEYVAATLSGVFSLEDALKVIFERGRLMQSMPAGNMLAINKKPADIVNYLSSNVEVSVINAPEYCVISGLTEDINNLKISLSHDNIESIILHTSHAFHSKMMEKAAERFTQFLKRIPLNIPNTPFVSNRTGKFITNEQAISPMYWGLHIKEPVLFSQGIQSLIESYDNPIFCEIGPGHVLSSFVKLHRNKDHNPLLAVNTLCSAKQYRSSQNDLSIYEFVAKLWCYKYPIDFKKIYTSNNTKNVALPAYQFEKQRCWVDKPSVTMQTTADKVVIPIKKSIPKTLNHLIELDTNEVERNIAKIFYGILGAEKFSKNDNFFDLGGTSLSAVKLISQLQSLNINPSISELVNYNSVYKLANYNKQTKVSEKIIVPLKINPNASQNIFFIHPVGGTLILYDEMIRKLNPSFNYYGIQNINADGQIIAKASTLEELATMYVNEITKIQSQGSFTLMGASLGGTVAYEMAKQLKSLNKNINFIAMFDAWAFFSESFHDQDIFNDAMVTQMKNDLIQFSDSLVDLKIENKALIDNICKARWKLMKLLLSYVVPKFNTNIDIHLFKSMTLDKHHAAHGVVVDNGWQKHIKSPLQIYNIPGDHTSILRRPGVEKIVSILNGLLSESKNSNFVYENIGKISAKVTSNF